MRNFIIFIITFQLIACKQKNEQFIKELEINALENKLSIDTRFKVIELNIIDTIYNKDIAHSLKDSLNSITEITEPFELTQEKFKKFRYQEIELRGDPNYYKNYVDNQELDSEWLKTLRIISSRTDELLSNFNETPYSEKLELFSWYSLRFWNFSQNKKYIDFYSNMIEVAKQAKLVEEEIETLEREPETINYILTEAKYSQLNPLLNNQKQTLTDKFKFDNNMKLIK